MEYKITSKEFDRFRTLIYDESGISLGQQKQSLLESRLSKRLRELGLETFSQYYDKVTGDPTQEEFTRMLDLISTNKTDFFRESKHFDFLREVILPELMPEIDGRFVFFGLFALTAGLAGCLPCTALSRFAASAARRLSDC